MAISKEQTEALLAMMASANSDKLDCGNCFERMAEFVEAELQNREIPNALECVRQHLEQCSCCSDEHNALLEALRSLDATDRS